MSFNIFWEETKLLFNKIPWHGIFFVFFLFSLPFSIRKVLGVFSVDGTFNEYMDVSLYLSDILLAITFFLYILNNKSSILSIRHWQRMFHVEHLLFPIFIPFFFVFWSGLSVFWSESFPLALFAFIKLIEMYSLYLYIISNVPRGTFGKNSQECSTWNIWQITFITIIISAFFQSIVAILQFIQQKSLGISIFKESIFSAYDPGIAKVIINGSIFIRSYGFFPHPNVLGGFLAVSLLLSTAYPLIFKNKMFHVEHPINTWLYRVLIFVQLLALLFSFSKSAILAFIIGFIMFIWGMHKMFHVEHSGGTKDISDVPRGTFGLQPKPDQCSTWNIPYIIQKVSQMFHVEHLLILTGVVLSVIILFSFNLRFFLIQPFIERLFYTQSLRSLSQTYFFQGLGIGQFVFRMQEFFDEKLLLWQFQPIHNVFLLIFSETGIVGFGLFMWFFVYAFWKNKRNVPRGTLKIQPKPDKCSTWNIPYIIQKVSQMFHVEHYQNTSFNEYLESRKNTLLNYLFRSILIEIIIIMLFDHYFWDIQQGQLLLWIILALAISKKD
jgi:O-Antigen ligase